MSIFIGTDTFGRVRTVGGTPIVTKFYLFEGLPLYPIESYYFAGSDTASLNIPFSGGHQSVSVAGLPLKTLDRVSVAMAYVRGVFGLLVLIGFMAIVPLFGSWLGDPLDQLGLYLTRVLIGCFVFGVVGGLISYCVPLTSRREQAIRSYCGEALGVCADPARVSDGAIVGVEATITQLGHTEGGGGQDHTRNPLLAELIRARVQIAKGIDVEDYEYVTDDVITRLRYLNESQ